MGDDTLMAAREAAIQAADKTSMDHAKKTAVEHVDWFLSAIRPLLIDHFVHGYKHGVEACGKTPGGDDA